MDRIDSVAAFIEVAEHRSFAAAARRLGRSPTAVTRMIGALEARLGVRLLNRTTRAVNVTEAGQRFLAGAKRVVVIMEHSNKDGQPKILKQCALPLTGKAVVHQVITDLAVLDVTREGLVLREVAPGVSAITYRCGS